MRTESLAGRLPSFRNTFRALAFAETVLLAACSTPMEQNYVMGHPLKACIVNELYVPARIVSGANGQEKSIEPQLRLRLALTESGGYASVLSRGEQADRNRQRFDQGDLVEVTLIAYGRGRIKDLRNKLKRDLLAGTLHTNPNLPEDSTYTRADIDLVEKGGCR
ncbi:hypothetical protein HYW42_04670 [Candidatus Daviesbacteria bacterium]|nr:hypothetical protein [Candidatus Daviesbacteria bacterium]